MKQIHIFLKSALLLPILVVICTFSFGQVTTQTYTYSGTIETFVVPAGVYSIHIVAEGASGGSVSVSCAASGGLGAQMSGDFSVVPGDTLRILVGQQGYTNGADAGGGGGSFVVASGNVPLIVAGGGGGATNNIGQCGSNRNGVDASITSSGTASANGLVAGGINGSGGGASTGSGGGGGGFLTNGIAGTGFANNNGKSFLNGGIGGSGNNNDSGGFGGGGAGWFTGGNGGGGGGYSGGATSGTQPFSGGGGGGSYNAGTNQVNMAGANSGNGEVIISYMVAPATINTEPTNTAACENTIATFSIQSINTTSYQWQVNDGLGWANVSGPIYSGTTDSTLTVSGVGLGMSGYQYRCIAFGAGGNDTSNVATLTVNAAPAAPTVSPLSIAINPGQFVSFVAVPAMGNTINWFNAANSLVYSGTTYTTPVNPSGTTYSSTETNTLLCEGPETNLTISIKPVLTFGGRKAN